MKRSKSIFSLLIAATLPLLLLACDFGSNNPTQVNTKIDLKNGQALYGVWEKLDMEIGGNLSWNLLFTDSGAYFIYEQFSGDSLGAKGGVLALRKSEWSADSNTISFQSNPYLLLNLSKQWPYYSSAPGYYPSPTKVLPTHQTAGFTYEASTFSNWDTLSWVHSLYRVNLPADSSAKPTYLVLGAPYEFTVLSIQAARGGAQELHVTDRACYDKNKNAASIDSVCEVSVFTKHTRPYYSDILKTVDTVSSTDVWNTDGGIPSGSLINTVKRGQEDGSILVH